MSGQGAHHPFEGSRAEEALRRLMATVSEHWIVLDRDHCIIDVNYTELHERNAVLGKRIDDLATGATRDAMIAALEHTFATGERSVYQGVMVEKGGELRHYRNDVVPLSAAPVQWVLMRAFNVTDRVKAEHALSESEARYRSLTDHLPDFAVILDRERRFQWVNRVAPGLTPEQVLGARIDDFSSPDAVPDTVAAIEEAFRTGEPTQFVGRTDAVGGSPRWYSTRVVPMRQDEQLDRVLLLTTDVTEQKRAELALIASEQRLEQALAAAEIGLWEWTPSRNVVQVSEVWARAAGRSAGEIGLEEFYASLHSEDVQRVRLALEGAASADAGSFELEYRVCASAGDAGRWLLHRGRLVAAGEPSEPPRVLGTQLDVTGRREAERERLSLQEQLQRAQRLESIGQLAGGVAHDFNNLLLVVLSQTELAERATARGEDPARALAEVRAASERAAELTKQLLAFSRRQGLETRPIALGTHVSGLSAMLRRLIPENITLEHVSHGGSDVAAVDPGQLEQVLLNLCLNARDAMPDGGSIVIETGTVELGDEALREQPAATPGPYVSLRVRDTGPGIPAAVRERMFEPFFTTKPAGRGTGLGLSVSEGIVKQHGGWVRVESALGQGTTVEVLLPLSERLASARPAPASTEPGVGTETLLVAEDEDMVRRLVVQILRGAGYRVLEARNGEEAVATVAEHPGRIALVLLDAVMPNMGGREAYERIAAIDPNARFLISSGYSDEQMPAPLIERERLATLPKPYAPDDLLRAVRAVLDESR